MLKHLLVLITTKNSRRISSILIENTKHNYIINTTFRQVVYFLAVKAASYSNYSPLIHIKITQKLQKLFIHTTIIKSYPQNVDKMLITFSTHVKIIYTTFLKGLFYACFYVCA